MDRFELEQLCDHLARIADQLEFQSAAILAGALIRETGLPKLPHEIAELANDIKMCAREPSDGTKYKRWAADYQRRHGTT